MAKADDIINEILELIDQRVNKFNDKMPDLQKQTYAVVLDLASELETTDGVIKPTVKNIKTIAKIKSELNKVIFTKEYTDELDDLIKTYEEVTKLQNQYFTSAIGKFTVPAVLKEVQNLAQQSVVDSLGEDAIGANFVSPIRDILVKNVTTGGSRAEFIEQARDFILGQEGTDGKLVKYTGQIVTDSLNQYSRNYAQTISNDLGLEWYMYVGSNKETTRDFCKALTAASKTCLPYIHKSQLPEIISGNICGEQVPIYDKTGLPYGMIPGTNIANFETNVGGYRCNHALRAVSSALVPKELRDRFERGIVAEDINTEEVGNKAEEEAKRAIILDKYTTQLEKNQSKTLFDTKNPEAAKREAFLNLWKEQNPGIWSQYKNQFQGLGLEDIKDFLQGEDLLPINATEQGLFGDANGFKEKPIVANKNDFEELLKSGEFKEIRRGLRTTDDGRTPNQLADQFKNGTMFNGYGVYGDGTYFDIGSVDPTNPSEKFPAALAYGDNNPNNVFRALVPNNANLIKWNDVELAEKYLKSGNVKYRNQMEQIGYPKEIIDRIEKLANTNWVPPNDRGALMTAFGFDGILVEEITDNGEKLNYLNFFNRSKLIVLE